MADSGIFTNIFTLIDDSIVKVVVSKSSNLITVIEPLLLSGFTVYLLFLFISYWNSSFEENIVDFFKRSMAWFIILGLSLNLGNYEEYVVPFVLGFGDGLSRTFSGADTTINGSLDELAMTVLDGISATIEEADGVSATVVAVLIILLISIFSVIFLIISAGYILLAKIFAGILVVVGPLFISLALFPATRQFFSAWINQIINYSLLTLFIHILMAIFIQFMVNAFGTGYIDLARGFNIAIGAGIFFVILLKLPDLASGLAGGIASNGFSQAGRIAKAVATSGKSEAGKSPAPNPNKNSMEKK